MMLMAGKYKLVSVCQRSGTNNVLFSGFFINFYIIDFSVPILIINFFFMIYSIFIWKISPIVLYYWIVKARLSAQRWSVNYRWFIFAV